MRIASLLVVVVLMPSVLCADLIVPADVVAIPSGTVGSGNGTIDLRMFTFSGSEIGNQSGAFNGDNGNNTLPHSNSSPSFAESYVTTAGKVQAFYMLNFPNGSGGSAVNEIVLLLDLSETNGVEETNNGLTVVNIFQNPTTIGGNPNPVGNDVTSDEQAAINQVLTGGSMLANLSTSLTLPTVANGAGHADYGIFTGINPFSLSASTVLLFNISMTGLSNGSEEIFLSGRFSGGDISSAVPEPSAFLFGGLVASVIGCAAGVRRLWAKQPSNS